MKELAIEALVVGIILAIILVIMCKVLPHDSDKNIAIIGLVSGVLTHLLFEFAGGNKWYCDNGYACQ